MSTGFEFNIPVTPRAVDRDMYGVKEFPVGASKFFPTTDRKARGAVFRCAHSANTNSIFVTRRAEQDGVQGFRIWRTV